MPFVKIVLARFARRHEQFTADISPGLGTRGRNVFLRFGTSISSPSPFRHSCRRRWSTGAPSVVAEVMDKFRLDFQGDFSKALPEFDTAEERRERIIEVRSWLYSTDHIKVQYGIMYDGTPIERLSPGTRGIVLLLLYLAIDTHDLRPLFIDQPEENLDPRSVFKELVPQQELTQLLRATVEHMRKER